MALKQAILRAKSSSCQHNVWFCVSAAYSLKVMYGLAEAVLYHLEVQIKNWTRVMTYQKYIY